MPRSVASTGGTGSPRTFRADLLLCIALQSVPWLAKHLRKPRHVRDLIAGQKTAVLAVQEIARRKSIRRTVSVIANVKRLTLDRLRGGD